MKFGTEADNEGCSGMELFISIALIAVVVLITTYKLGYDQGRNDGFHAGWREAMEVGLKEVKHGQVD